MDCAVFPAPNPAPERSFPAPEQLGAGNVTLGAGLSAHRRPRCVPAPRERENGTYSLWKRHFKEVKTAFQGG